jgi:hypothetical protein
VSSFFSFHHDLVCWANDPIFMRIFGLPARVGPRRQHKTKELDAALPLYPG